MTRPDEDLNSSDDGAPDLHDVEAPEADAAEQARTAYPTERSQPVRRSNDVDEYDALEQAQIVDIDDEYR